MTPNPPDEDKANLISNILAIVGFIIVIAIAIWGLLSFAGLSKSFWASTFKKTETALKVTAPGAGASGGAATTAQAGETSAYEDVAPPPAAKAEVAPPAKQESGLPAQAGLPDLSVRILSVGVIEPISGDIVPRRPNSPNDLVAVRFDISNEGASPTGTWYFAAHLPTEPPYTYSSPPQKPLAPKEHVENALRFRQVPPEGGTFSVYADPYNLIREPNEVNNYVNQNI